jgi:hypothetical protein
MFSIKVASENHVELKQACQTQIAARAAKSFQ